MFCNAPKRFPEQNLGSKFLAEPPDKAHHAPCLPIFSTEGKEVRPIGNGTCTGAFDLRFRNARFGELV